jgi:hypothetical protein
MTNKPVGHAGWRFRATEASHGMRRHAMPLSLAPHMDHADDEEE